MPRRFEMEKKIHWPHVALTWLSRGRWITSGLFRCSRSTRSIGSRALATVCYGNAYGLVQIKRGWHNCMHTLTRSICDLCSGMFHCSGKLIKGLSAFWLPTKLIPRIFRCSSLRKNLIPWNRQISPAHLRVHDTHLGKSSERYRLDMHLANCNSGWSFGIPSPAETPKKKALKIRPVDFDREWADLQMPHQWRSPLLQAWKKP